MGKRKKRKILYEKWKETHEAEWEKEEIGEAIGEETEKIVVRKVTLMLRVFQIAWEIISFIIKSVMVLMIIGLLTLAIVVLLNEPLRMMVFEFFKRKF